MGRHGKGSARGFRVRWIGPDHYRMTWTVDRYYKGSMLRFPTGFHRDTDRRGAELFARKHEISILGEPQATETGRQALAEGDGNG